MFVEPAVKRDVEGEGNGPDGPFTAPPPEQRKRTGKHQKAAKAKVIDQASTICISDVSYRTTEPSANGTGEDSPQTTTTPPPTPGARPPNRRKKNTPSKCAQ
ncbi:hypothetical protein APUTEX25_000560 [Auxenochlorella protothecoides]|uniref:Uncharacterized protein n=1 Tax=Auxenochlorella protothecoides TaxID=3075 RepID=A0A3M7L0P3_AUXPR|nr:hypothetical protein APUTEX25_000560 [Auxenochlorella protothecoides]|eukprot:RMZ56321.1 hypothetical protein APUTEX25_000560 [Auxenochlorella protothecoides]